ncbi:hypothetical protein ACMHYB_26400 [Sorangium sp. So ce1128]
MLDCVHLVVNNAGVYAGVRVGKNPLEDWMRGASVLHGCHAPSLRFR